MAMTITYKVKNGIYVNMTNRCPCACTFCLRQNAPGVYGSDPLWLDREPTVGEVEQSLSKWDLSSMDEVVFCGYGEPTCAFDMLKRVAAEVKRRYSLPVRVNTNGQGSLICGRDIAPEFEGIVDTVSISLNTPNADEYAAIVRSRFGDAAFPGMLDFAREVRKYVPNVVMTTVETTISHEDEAACQRICDELGVRYRIRAWVNS